MLRKEKEREVLIGNWEEPGVIGTRIEIDRSRVLVLWRNDAVLDTPYTVRKDEKTDVLRLELRRTGLRYSKASSDYAEVTGLEYADGVLRFREHFPISGDSESLLRKTENSRYGNYTVVDNEILPQLQGEWVCEGWSLPFRIRGDRMTVNGETLPIHVLQSRGSCPDGYKIVHADPSHYDLHHFIEVMFDGSEIRAVLPVCDAPSMCFVYRRA